MTTVETITRDDGVSQRGVWLELDKESGGHTSELFIHAEDASKDYRRIIKTKEFLQRNTINLQEASLQRSLTESEQSELNFYMKIIDLLT